MATTRGGVLASFSPRPSADDKVLEKENEAQGQKNDVTFSTADEKAAHTLRSPESGPEEVGCQPALRSWLLIYPSVRLFFSPRLSSPRRIHSPDARRPSPSHRPSSPARSIRHFPFSPPAALGAQATPRGPPRNCGPSVGCTHPDIEYARPSRSSSGRTASLHGRHTSFLFAQIGRAHV